MPAQSGESVWEALPSRFKPARSAPAHDAGPNRDARCTGRSPGLTRLNVEATQVALKAAGYPPDFGNMGVYLTADPAVNEVGGRLVRSGYKGTTPMRYLSRNRTLVIYLHTIFRDYPQLRPVAIEGAHPPLASFSPAIAQTGQRQG